MTDDQFADLVSDMELGWGRKLEVEIVAHWWREGLFSDLDYSDARAAVAALAATSQWMPMPSDIRGWIARHASPAMDALWGEVWAELMEERSQPRPWSQAQWSAAVAPFMAWAGPVTLASIAPGSDTPIDVAQAQIRKKWEDWRAREMERRVTIGIPAVRAFADRHRPRLAAAHYPELTPALDEVAKKRASRGLDGD